MKTVLFYFNTENIFYARFYYSVCTRYGGHLLELTFRFEQLKVVEGVYHKISERKMNVYIKFYFNFMRSKIFLRR